MQEAVWTVKWYGSGEVAPYNGRWDRLQSWLIELDVAPAAHIATDRRNVLVFGTPGFADYLMAVSVVLAARGCEIDYVWLGHLDPAGNPDVTRFERWSEKFPVPPGHDRLRIHRVHDTPPAECDEEMVALARRIAELDTCHIRCKEVCEEQTDPGDNHVFEFRLARNLDFLRRLKTFLVGRHYASALCGNGRVWEMACFYEWVRRAGIPCTTMEMFEMGRSIIASQTQVVVDCLTEAIWKADEPHLLTPERERRVLERIAFREDPNRQSDHAPKLQTVPPDTAALCKKLQLDPARRTALLCTNVAWDSSVLGHGRAFPTMKEWYLRTIAWYADRVGWQLIVRTHPLEGLVDQPMSVSDYIDEHYPELPPNVRLVRPTDKVNTYGLLPIIDLGLVFTSTVGLEMAIRGLPVITAGWIHYDRKGFTKDPTSEGEYFCLLEEADHSARRLPDMLRDLARCYFDVYFEKWARPTPWGMWDMARDMENWPMARILAGDCPEEFLKTFDYLAGRHDLGVL